MMMRHCNVNQEPLEVWFLKDIDLFSDRMLLIGNCSECGKKIATLVEIRISDDVPFVDNLSGISAERVIENERKRIDYTLNSLNKHYSGWTYGINKEIKNKSGSVTQIRQYASNFDGKKKLVKRIIF